MACFPGCSRPMSNSDGRTRVCPDTCFRFRGRDPQVVRDYDADPLNCHSKLPARTVHEFAGTVARFLDEVTRLTLPLLLMHGTGDRLVPMHGTEMVYERAR